MVFCLNLPRLKKQDHTPNTLHHMNILIIGATSGIGHALYSHYVSCGNNVAIMGRRKNILDKLHAASPSNTLSLQTDISDIASFNSAFAEVLNSLKVIDLAIVCAGIGELNDSLNIQQELTTLSVNVVGWTNVVDTLYNYFEKSGSGHLVTVTSVGGWQPTPIAPSYSASKAFQINYTKSLQAKAKKIRHHHHRNTPRLGRHTNGKRKRPFLGNAS